MADRIQEFVDSRGVTLRVDRQKGVLRGVKLIGLESRNGRRYREAALASAIAMYEEAKVNVNHPKDGPATPRDYQDRLGVIRGVELRRGEGLFADLHFNPKHALAEQLLWDAQHNPRNVGFSHNVLARLSRDGEIAVVEEITKVQSVDLVADPATTEGLFEARSQTSINAGRGTEPWERLTAETLQRHRPDLVEEVIAREGEKGQEELARVEVELERLERKHRVLQLLCEHQLAVPEASVDPSERASQVSCEFIEALEKASNDDVVKSLILERAELAQAVKSSRRAEARSTVPFSREQTQLISHLHSPPPTAREFAGLLKSSLN